MVRDRRRSRLGRGVQEELIKYFCGGVTARAAAEISGVNRNTAILFYHKLREVIFAALEAEAPELLAGEIEVDEPIAFRICLKACAGQWITKAGQRISLQSQLCRRHVRYVADCLRGRIITRALPIVADDRRRQRTIIAEVQGQTGRMQVAIAECARRTCHAALIVTAILRVQGKTCAETGRDWPANKCAAVDRIEIAEVARNMLSVRHEFSYRRDHPH